MSMNKASLFQLRQVRKEYRRTVAVNLKALDIPAGEILCLLGPTGAGKSTLLRLLATVERPTTGNILFEGESLMKSLPLSTRRRITMTFQRPVLLTGTVRSNVEYGLRLRGGKHRPPPPRV